MKAHRVSIKCCIYTQIFPGRRSGCNLLPAMKTLNGLCAKPHMRMAGAILLVLACQVPTLASPGNPERYPIGARATGMGGAAVAFGTLPWHNLAGLGHLDGEGLSASLSAYGYSSASVGKFIAGAGPLEGSLSTSTVDLFPSSLGYVKPLGRLGSLRHGIGVSVVVPNYDLFSGNATIHSESVALEANFVINASDQTTWVNAGWGACNQSQSLCLGIGPVLALQQQQDRVLFTLNTVTQDGDINAFTSSSNTEQLALAAGAQVGLQSKIAPNTWIGASVRSPMRTVFGKGSLLNIDGSIQTGEDGQSYLDRVEILEPEIDFRQPWRIAIGAGYDKPNAWACALDLRWSLAQSRYAALSGPSGETTIAPIDPFTGEPLADPERAINVASYKEQESTLNLNLGVEAHASRSIIVQAGLFTDVSAEPASSVQTGEGNFRVSRLGATLGLGLAGKRSTTRLNLVGAYGGGQSVGFNQGLDVSAADMESWSLMAMLGSTAALGD